MQCDLLQHLVLQQAMVNYCLGYCLAEGNQSDEEENATVFQMVPNMESVTQGIEGNCMQRLSEIVSKFDSLS